MACVGICMICFITGEAVTGLVNLKTVSNGYQILPANGSNFRNVCVHIEYIVIILLKYVADMTDKNTYMGGGSGALYRHMTMLLSFSIIIVFG